MSHWEPGVSAAVDQEIADLRDQVNYMVRMFRERAVEQGDAQTIADLSATVNAMYEGSARGSLVAVAVWLLASGGESL